MRGRTKVDMTDTLFSKYVRLLEGGYCRVCKKYFGLTQGLHVHHYKSRGKRSVRWDRDNACALCTYDHFKIQHNEAANTELFLNILGQERFEALLIRAETLHKYTKEEIKAIRKDLRTKIASLE